MRDGSEPSIREHLIDIAADQIIELKSDFLATGKLLPTKGTPHEHSFKAGTIGSRYPENGFGGFSLVWKHTTRTFFDGC
jgi:aldose 1-epimerase